MRPFGLIFDNLGLKVLALLMAWAIWFMARSNITDTAPLSVPVKVTIEEGNDAWRVSHPAKITLQVEGAARTVAQLAAERDVTAVVVFATQPPDKPEHTSMYRLADLEIPALEQFDDVRVLRMDPDSFRVDGKRMVEDVVKIPRPSVSSRVGATDIVVLEWDDSVRVRAAQTDLKNLGGEQLRTLVPDERLLELSGSLGVLGRLVTKVRLDIDPEQRSAYDFEIREPKELSVWLELRSIDERHVTLPLHIHVVASTEPETSRALQFAPGNEIGMAYTPGEGGAPPTLRVTLEGTPAEIDKVDASQLRAYVLGDGLPDGQVVYNLPVHVQGLPFGVRLKDAPVIKVISQ